VSFGPRERSRASASEVRRNVALRVTRVTTRLAQGHVGPDYETKILTANTSMARSNSASDGKLGAMRILVSSGSLL
jgi:hypothetical protein